MDLFVAGDPHFEPWVPGFDGDAGVDDEDAFGVVDDEDPDGLPFGGPAGGDHSCGEEVEADGPAVGREFDGLGRKHVVSSYLFLTVSSHFLFSGFGRAVCCRRRVISRGRGMGRWRLR